MATGTTFVFEEFALDVLNGIHNFSSNTYKMGLIDNSAAPAATQATPTWSDFSANEVSGTGYSAGGEAVTVSISEVGGVATVDFSIVTFAYNSAGPEDAYYGIIYNDTAAGKNAVASIDLGGPKSMRVGDLTVDANASGLFKLTVTP